jgi:hypothetical protein
LISGFDYPFGIFKLFFGLLIRIRIPTLCAAAFVILCADYR